MSSGPRSAGKRRLVPYLVKLALRDCTGQLEIRSPGGVARIYLHRQHIAWAHASTVRVYFSDVLADHAHLPLPYLRKVVDECKRTRRKLGEYLAQEGILTYETLRECLRRHVGIHLQAAVELPGPLEMSFTEQSHRYDPRLLFSVDEALAALEGVPEAMLDPDETLPPPGDLEPQEGAVEDERIDRQERFVEVVLRYAYQHLQKLRAASVIDLQRGCIRLGGSAIDEAAGNVLSDLEPRVAAWFSTGPTELETEGLGAFPGTMDELVVSGAGVLAYAGRLAAYSHLAFVAAMHLEGGVGGALSRARLVCELADRATRPTMPYGLGSGGAS